MLSNRGSSRPSPNVGPGGNRLMFRVRGSFIPRTKRYDALAVRSRATKCSTEKLATSGCPPGGTESKDREANVPARREPRRELLGLVNGARHIQQDFNPERERLRS